MAEQSPASNPVPKAVSERGARVSGRVRALMEEHQLPPSSTGYLVELIHGAEVARERRLAAIDRARRRRPVDPTTYAKAVASMDASHEETISQAIAGHKWGIEEKERQAQAAASMMSKGLVGFDLISKALSPLSTGAAYAYRKLGLEGYTDAEMARLAEVLPPSLSGYRYEDYKAVGLTGLDPAESVKNAFDQTFAGESVPTALHSVAIGEHDDYSAIGPFQAQQAIRAIDESREQAPVGTKILSGAAAGAGTLGGFLPHMANLRATAKGVERAARAVRSPGPRAGMAGPAGRLVRTAGDISAEAAAFALATGAATEFGGLTGEAVLESAKTGALFGTTGKIGGWLGQKAPRIGGTSIPERVIRGTTTGATVAGLHSAHGGGWDDWAGEALLFGVAGARGGKPPERKAPVAAEGDRAPRTARTLWQRGFKERSRAEEPRREDSPEFTDTNKQTLDVGPIWGRQTEAQLRSNVASASRELLPLVEQQNSRMAFLKTLEDRAEFEPTKSGGLGVRATKTLDVAVRESVVELARSRGDEARLSLEGDIKDLVHTKLKMRPPKEEGGEWTLAKDSYVPTDRQLKASLERIIQADQLSAVNNPDGLQLYRWVNRKGTPDQYVLAPNKKVADDIHARWKKEYGKEADHQQALKTAKAEGRAKRKKAKDKQRKLNPTAKESTTAKKATANESTTAKKDTAKKATANESTTAKKATAKKATAKKATAKKATAKKAPAKTAGPDKRGRDKRYSSENLRRKE